MHRWQDKILHNEAFAALLMSARKKPFPFNH
jgi:hypothetical protein